jgi:hypothetical protein
LATIPAGNFFSTRSSCPASLSYGIPSTFTSSGLAMVAEVSGAPTIILERFGTFT